MPRKKLPNIILIVLDTARAKSFSCYGYHRKTTPNIDRIAEEGVLYKWCFSPANWTIPAHASLFTGLYPSEHGCHAGSLFLDENIPTLAELLRSAGYRTIGVSCNCSVSKLLGFHKGFDLFFELWTPHLFPDLEPLPGKVLTDKVLSLLKLIPVNPGLAAKYAVRVIWGKWRRFRGGVLENSTPWTLRAFKVARRAIRETFQDKPLFLFVNVMQTHQRYNPPHGPRGKFGSNGFRYEDFFTEPAQYYLDSFNLGISSEKMWRTLTALYDEELLFVDWCIRQFYEFLKSMRLLDRSVFIITSDHGEMLGEHDLFDHFFGSYNELIHVPLIIRYPGPNQGEIVSKIVQTNDLFSTICDIAELPYPSPTSSISLGGNEQRQWVLIQDIDPLADVLALRRRQPEWTNDAWWCYPSTTVINSSLQKIIKPIGTRLFHFDLVQDYTEQYPKVVSCTEEEELLRLATEIEKIYDWDQAVKLCEDMLLSEKVRHVLIW